VRVERQAPVQQILGKGQGLGWRQLEVIRNAWNAFASPRKWSTEGIAGTIASGPAGFVARTLIHGLIMASMHGRLFAMLGPAGKKKAASPRRFSELALLRRLAMRIGNPSLSRVESGFPAITQPPLDSRPLSPSRTQRRNPLKSDTFVEADQELT
jgi:hypothetical protein